MLLPLGSTSLVARLRVSNAHVEVLVPAPGTVSMRVVRLPSQAYLTLFVPVTPVRVYTMEVTRRFASQHSYSSLPFDSIT